MTEELKQRIAAVCEEVQPQLREIRDKMHAHPEIGGTEEFASGMLIEALRAAGFSVETDYAGYPYAFRGEFVFTEDGPTVGLFMEYDALPEMGHACGHNIICTPSLGAAVALAAQKGSELRGKLVVYGTPGEENLCTKALLVNDGYLRELDAALMAHPYPRTVIGSRTYALEALKIEFFGRASHAGAAPEKGINALDSAVDCYRAIRDMSARYPMANIHGIIENGGERASVIPGYSSLVYFTRAWEDDVLRQIRSEIETIAQEAADTYGCGVKVWNHEPPNRAMKNDQVLSGIFEKYWREVAPEDEISHEDLTGSTDMADVSWVVPSIHPWVSLECPDAELHNERFGEAVISEKGDRYLQRVTKALAWTAGTVLLS